MKESEILDVIRNDAQMLEVLRIAESLELNDWLIGSGFVRNKIWNHLSGRVTDKIDATDIDLVYFDSTENKQERDELLVKKLFKDTGMDWEIRNNTFDYKSNIRSNYKSAKDVISAWPETATSIGVTIIEGDLKLVAPYGVHELVNFIIRPSPKYLDGIDRIRERIEKKEWLKKWPNLRIEL